MTKSLPAGPEKLKDGADVVKILRDANHGCKGSGEALAKLLDEQPEWARIGGDVARLAENAVIAMATGGNVLRQESTHRWLAKEHEALSQPGDGELERLLVQRVILTRLALNSAEEVRAEKWQKGISTADALFWDKHVSRLNGDFLKACRALALSRRLLRPQIVAQMNIADKQQINIAAANQSIEAADAE